MNRNAIEVSGAHLDACIKALRKLEVPISSVSTTKDKYLIIYRSEISYKLESLLEVCENAR